MLVCPRCRKGRFESEWGVFSYVCKYCESDLKERNKKKMDYNKNNHYTNKHGQELAEFMKAKGPEAWEIICAWSALKYAVRAGKKDGESIEKDLGKRDDYIKDLLGLTGDTYEEALEEVNAVKDMFEKWEGE